MAEETDTSTLRQRGHLLIYGNTSLSRAQDRALNHWWSNQHLPERIRIPGFVSGKRYVAIDLFDDVRRDPEEKVNRGYLIWYSTTSLDVLNSGPYLERLENPTEATQLHMPIIASLNRSVCRVLSIAASNEWLELRARGGSLTGGLLVHFWADVPHSENPEARVDSAREVLRTLWLNDLRMLSTTILQHDERATQVGNTSATADDAVFEQRDLSDSRWHFLIDFAHYASEADISEHNAFTQRIYDDFRAIDMTVSEIRLYSLIVSAHS